LSQDLANTVIYSFMEPILLRSLPIADPESLVVMSWRSKPFNLRDNELVMRAMDGSTNRFFAGIGSRMFPFLAYARLRAVSAPALASVFAHKSAGRMNVMILVRQSAATFITSPAISSVASRYGRSPACR
jgi:hypothetical protein